MKRICATNGANPAKTVFPSFGGVNKNGKGDRKMGKIITVVLVLCIAAFAQQKGTFTDSRDKKTYKTVKIGEQTWMAENLNYNAKGSKCYENKPANCQKYGRLYYWNTVACPKSWHLPDSTEWNILTEAVGGEEKADKILKATSGWKDNGNGEDKFGFAALPGGFGEEGNDGDFHYVGDYGYWWSATAVDDDIVYSRFMSYNSESVRKNYGNINDKLYSIRCVKD